jgi:hypothetical protein
MEFCRVGLRDEEFNSLVIPAKAGIQPNFKYILNKTTSFPPSRE